MDRRNLIKAAAWATPVVALAIAAPQAAASEPGTCTTYGIKFTHTPTQYDVAKITVVVGSFLRIEYIKDVDLLEINVHIKGQSKNIKNTKPVKAGYVYEVPFSSLFPYASASDKCLDLTFVQVHGNNTHYYGNGVYR